MEIPVEALIAFVAGVHARTDEAVALLCDDDLHWRPAPGEFAAGELALHIAAARRMNIASIRGERAVYRGHAVPAGATALSVRATLLRASKKVIAGLHDADLAAGVRTIMGTPIPAWRLLFSGLVEHEVHHRSQLCGYLGALGRPVPPLFGLHAEDLPRS